MREPPGSSESLLLLAIRFTSAPLYPQLRSFIERNGSTAAYAYAALPTPMIVQNKTLASDIYVDGMYAPDSLARGSRS
mgnify:CR=1 FL=1|eukprot:scaffold324569_cov68-Tisochrysis_lutea.AAC.3